MTNQSQRMPSTSSGNTLLKTFCFLTLCAIGSGTLLISLSRGLLFFVDSNTYLSRRFYEFVLTETTYLFPVSTLCIALFNVWVVFKLGRDRPIVAMLFFLSPYQFLLLTNLTKESIFFVSIVIFSYIRVQHPDRKLLQFLPLVAMISRPIYLAAYFVRPNLWPILILSVLLLNLWFPEVFDKLVSEFFRRTNDRELVNHNNGRDFFIGYCVAEKANMFSMLGCLLPGLFFFPNQPSLGLQEYIVFALFHISIWIVVIKLISTKQFFYAFLMLVSYFLIFLMAPTFGSFIRYFYPQLWLFGAQAFYLRR